MKGRHYIIGASAFAVLAGIAADLGMPATALALAFVAIATWAAICLTDEI